MQLLATYKCTRNQNPDTSVWFLFRERDVGIIDIDDPDYNEIFETEDEELINNLEDFERREKENI